MKVLLELNEKYNLLCDSYGHKYGHEEEWRDLVVEGVKTRYKVSNYGKIYDTENLETPKMFMHNKHYSTNIVVGDKNILGSVYRFVAMMFIPIPQKYIDAGYTMDDLIVDHKRDGDSDNWDDNTIWNLQWLTYRENTSKAFKCGQRDMYPKEFRSELDKLILEDKDNDYIYNFFYDKYKMTREELKPQVQVRRRRLGKTLKEHHERSKEELAKVDKLILAGLSNKEIIKKLKLPTEGRTSTSLLQHRRAKLKVPSQTSKFLTNDQNNELNLLLIQGVKTDDIVKFFGKQDLPEDELERFKATIRARRHQTKKRLEKEQGKEA